VTQESDALDLKRGVFKLRSAKAIAASLKHSAERSSRRKTGAYRSALSMLTFYINRAGRNLPKTERDRRWLVRSGACMQSYSKRKTRAWVPAQGRTTMGLHPTPPGCSP
jgi:hypothetical protein